jgi:hypothetical protein
MHKKFRVIESNNKVFDEHQWSGYKNELTVFVYSDPSQYLSVLRIFCA